MPISYNYLISAYRLSSINLFVNPTLNAILNLMSRTFFLLVSIFSLSFFLNLSPPSTLAAGNYNSPMGITARNDNKASFRSLKNMENRIKLMVEAGADWDRLFVSYGYVNNPNDNLNRLDQIIALYRKYNLHPYFLLYNEATASTPFNSPPGEPSEWAKYLALLVDRYGNDVKYWEISFEENHPGYIFGAQPETYVNFLKDSAAVIRQHDSQAKIILGRLLPNNINYLASLLDLNAAPYFDVVSLGGPYQCDLYNEATTRINAVKNILARYGVTKPIWLTEALCVSDHDLDGASDAAGYEDQKKYIKEVYKQALAAGAQKIFQQSFVDRNDFTFVAKRMSGIMSIDSAFALHKKPSYSAYQQAARDAGFPPPSLTSNPADLTDEDDTPGNQVNEADYNLLLSDFGKTGSPGWIPADINDDGVVDEADYNELVGAFGE